jgi:transaldolase
MQFRVLQLLIQDLRSFRSIKEAIAAAELGCHSATLSPKLLDELAHTKYDQAMDVGKEIMKAENTYKNAAPVPERLQHLLETDPLAVNGFSPAQMDIDYLGNGGSGLAKALENDPVGSNRLKDAIALFVRAESASKTLIEYWMQRGSL